jgi:hypothetical protein
MITAHKNHFTTWQVPFESVNRCIIVIPDTSNIFPLVRHAMLPLECVPSSECALPWAINASHWLTRASKTLSPEQKQDIGLQLRDYIVYRLDAWLKPPKSSRLQATGGIGLFSVHRTVSHFHRLIPDGVPRAPWDTNLFSNPTRHHDMWPHSTACPLNSSAAYGTYLDTEELMTRILSRPLNVWLLSALFNILSTGVAVTCRICTMTLIWKARLYINRFVCITI